MAPEKLNADKKEIKIKNNFSEIEPDRHIDEKRAAEYLGISYKTLQGYRVKGGGPEFVKIGKKTVRYKFSDLQKWTENKKKKNTSQN
ncbi:MAG: helix-turn-helix domain-containing protein [Alphaproteobacteria bacterium]|nr:helix-turn-helix domain-containing protein [Alphaproteobacteria bacterium]